jgi:hypothetical protein
LSAVTLDLRELERVTLDLRELERVTDGAGGTAVDGSR